MGVVLGLPPLDNLTRRGLQCFTMRSKIAERTEKISAKIPSQQKRALDQMGVDNQRSTAAEIRIAIFNHLKQDGRIL